MKRFVFACFMFVIMAAMSVTGAFAMSDAKAANFVTDEWLKDNLDSVLLLDARGEKAYTAGHIEGALSSPWTAWTDLRGLKQGEPSWNTTKDVADLEKYLTSLGVAGGKQIIVYADPSGLGEDGRVMWELKLAGVDNVKLLDGGFSLWKLKGGHVTDKPSAAPSPVEYKIAALHENEHRIKMDELVAGKDGFKLIDTRSSSEYEGKTNHGEPRNGHIPGAVSIPFNEIYNDDGTVYDVDQIAALLDSKGIKKEDKIVTYCTIGIRSGFFSTMLRMAGYDARNYEASFSEWAGNKDLPVEK